MAIADARTNRATYLVDQLSHRTAGTELHALVSALRDAIFAPFVTADYAAKFVCGVATRAYGVVGIDVSRFSERLVRDERAARYLAMYLLRRAFRWTTPRIARSMALQDHSSVSSACRAIEARRRRDAAFDTLCGLALGECVAAAAVDPKLAMAIA